MRVFLISIFFLGPSLASPPLQLEDPRGFIHTFREERLRALLPEEAEVAPFNRLSREVIPEKYTLKIRPILYDDENGDLEYTAPGHVDILFNVASLTATVVLHKHPTLTISWETIKVRSVDETEDIPVNNIPTYNASNHFYTIRLRDNLSVGKKYILSMDFTASISDTTEGLYRATFTHGSQTYRMATTQFEPVSAREAFPCFDEPDLRATFKISIGRDSRKNFLTLSNQGKIGEEEIPGLTGWMWDNFSETKSMPTYLIALISTEGYSCTPSKPNEFGKPVQVCGPEHKLIGPRNGGVFAANASEQIIKYLQKEYSFAYEFDKMDSIAIPKGYFGGAMENWGLNTYMEDYLLYYEGESSEIHRNGILSILSHELAHQWFGNLVTCKWWSEIWLNEGFATYVSYTGIEHVAPEFDALNEILWGSVQYALNYDVDVNIPVRNSALTLKEVNSVFTTIVYDKGAALIRMLESVLGKATLHNAVVKYLQKHNYTGVEQDDLFAVLEEQAKEDNVVLPVTIKQLMDSWTLKPGFPLVRAYKVGSSRIHVSQEQFTKQGTANAIEISEYWEVPVKVISSSQPDIKSTTQAWLNTKSLSRSIQFEQNNDWYIVNPEAYGFYRVLYDNDLMALILKQLGADPTKLSAQIRSQLIDDYLNFAKNGYASITTALEFTTHLKTHVDTERFVWNPLFSSLSRALTLFGNEDISLFQNYFLKLIDPALTNVGDERGHNVLLQAKLLDWACALDSEVCKAKASNWFQNFDIDSVPLDLQTVAYCAIVAEERNAFELFVDLINNGGIPDFQRTRLALAVTCAQVPHHLQALLEWTLQEGTIFHDNALTILQKAGLNNNGRRIVFAFVRDKFDVIKNSSPNGLDIIASAIRTMSTAFTRQSEMESLQSFIEEKDKELPNNIRISLEMSVRNIESNMNWIKEFYADMNTWFQGQI